MGATSVNFKSVPGSSGRHPTELPPGSSAQGLDVYASQQPAKTSGSGLRRHNGDVDLHFVLAGGRDRAGRPGLVCVLRGWRRRKSDWQECALVRAGCNDLQLRRAGAVHRVERHVRPRRRVSRSEAGAGRNAGQAVCFGLAFRLRPDRPHQLGGSRTVLRRFSHRHTSPRSATTFIFPRTHSARCLRSW